MSPAPHPAHSKRIVLAGGAGLVGQNLVDRLLAQGQPELVVLDKDPARLRALRQRHPTVTTVTADLAESGPWADHLEGADAAVLLQAQISSPRETDFVRNNLVSTDRLLTALRQYRVPYTLLISSSVVCSVAEDPYARSKRTQEQRFLASGLPGAVLRPTLLFGPHDRHHLGWLVRFMKRSPLFPLPGRGRHLRQPLYVRDFCGVIAHCLHTRPQDTCTNITGLEPIDYVDLIRTLRRVSRARCLLLPLPVPLFGALLRLYGVITRQPPFTADQLNALVAGDRFEVNDWPARFAVQPTPLAEAFEQTFGNAQQHHD